MLPCRPLNDLSQGILDKTPESGVKGWTRWTQWGEDSDCRQCPPPCCTWNPPWSQIILFQSRTSERVLFSHRSRLLLRTGSQMKSHADSPLKKNKWCETLWESSGTKVTTTGCLVKLVTEVLVPPSQVPRPSVKWVGNLTLEVVPSQVPQPTLWSDCQVSWGTWLGATQPPSAVEAEQVLQIGCPSLYSFLLRIHTWIEIVSVVFFKTIQLAT